MLYAQCAVSNQDRATLADSAISEKCLVIGIESAALTMPGDDSLSVSMTFGAQVAWACGPALASEIGSAQPTAEPTQTTCAIHSFGPAKASLP